MTLQATFYITWTSATLSFIGCSFIIVAFLFIQERRRPIQRLIFFLTISDLLASLARIISHILRAIYNANSNKPGPDSLNISHYYHPNHEFFLRSARDDEYLTSKDSLGIVPHISYSTSSTASLRLANLPTSFDFSTPVGDSQSILESLTTEITRAITEIVGLGNGNGDGNEVSERVADIVPRGTGDLKWSCNYSVTIIYYFYLCSVCWIGCIATEMLLRYTQVYVTYFGQARLPIHQIDRRREAAYHIFSWLVPAALVLPAIIEGYDTMESSYDMCNWKSKEEKWLWMFTGFIIFMLIYGMVTYLIVNWRFHKTYATGALPLPEERRHRAQRIQASFFLLIFVFCWVWLPIYMSASSAGASPSKLHVIDTISSVIFPLVGFLNSIAYGWNKDIIRDFGRKLRVVCVCCCPKPIVVRLGLLRKQSSSNRRDDRSTDESGRREESERKAITEASEDETEEEDNDDEDEEDGEPAGDVEAELPDDDGEDAGLMVAGSRRSLFGRFSTDSYKYTNFLMLQRGYEGGAYELVVEKSVPDIPVNITTLDRIELL